MCFNTHTKLFLYKIKFESTKILGTLAIIHLTNYGSRRVENCKKVFPPTYAFDFGLIYLYICIDSTCSAAEDTQ